MNKHVNIHFKYLVFSVDLLVVKHCKKGGMLSLPIIIAWNEMFLNVLIGFVPLYDTVVYQYNDFF